MEISATARLPAVVYTPITDVIKDPSVAEAWFLALPDQVRRNLQARLEAIFRALPPVVQVRIQKSLIAQGEKPVLVPTIDGLGQWGAAAVAISSVGAQLFNAVSAGRLQKDIAEGAQSTSAQIAQAQIEASQQAQLAMIDAQRQAVALKALNSAQTGATVSKYLPFVLGGAGVLALVFVVIKARSKRIP